MPDSPYQKPETRTSYSDFDWLLAIGYNTTQNIRGFKESANSNIVINTNHAQIDIITFQSTIPEVEEDIDYVMLVAGGRAMDNTETQLVNLKTLGKWER